ncbi:putative F-box protein [Platanthera zijinensis]|uniref:F-box protein n=1 Tax=Platanthera zijinensis TaxID=2320716 RepID=A0AAP0BBW1_9ASPA
MDNSVEEETIIHGWRKRRDATEKHEECMSRIPHSSSLYLPECLVFNILLRLPAKSVGRFRCVSKLWLSISTDPYFIVTHTRRTPKPLVCPSIPLKNLLRRNELFNTASFGFEKQGTDVPLSSCDGLVSFISCFNSRGPPCWANNYVVNPLTGLRIDLPSPSADRYGKYSPMRELYYHRWTGQYRILNVNGKRAEVLSFGGTMNDYSWRLINSEPPGHVWVCWKKCVLVINDCLYWICETYSYGDRITVFDILEEAFSCMDLPHDVIIGGKEYGLVDIDGKLGCWMASNNAIDAYQINVWVEVEGGDKWRSAYSLHLGDDESRRLINRFSHYALIPFAFFSRGEFFFLVNGSVGMLYLLRWDLNSGNHSTQLLSHQPMGVSVRILIHKETLIDMATITQNV